MNKSDSIKELATALNKAQAEFSPAPLNSSNPHLRNKYADLGSIIESTKPILSKHGLSVSQMVYGVANEIGITTLLMHVSGEWLESSVIMPVMEQKGINNAQVAGSIISYLRRYSLASALGIYSGDDNDAQVGKPKVGRERVGQSSQPLEKELPQPRATTPAVNGNHFKGNIIEQWILEGYFDDKPSAVSVLNRSPFIKGQYTLETILTFAKAYRAWKDAGDETDAAIEKATRGEVPA